MMRLSSTSTETDYVPAMVPFNWEVEPGRPAVPNILDPPMLPLPPGKRPKDGFYLPFSRPAEFPPLHNEAGLKTSPKERTSFNLRYPGSSKKPFFTIQRPRKHSDMGRVEDRYLDGSFGHVSGHRIGSGITKRVLVEFQKRRSCLEGCWPSQGRKSSLTHKHHHTGRRLDSPNDSSKEEIRELSPTRTHSAATRSSTPSSASNHGHGRPRKPLGDRKQAQVKSQGIGSIRFMASMLMSLCPSDYGEHDEVEGVDTENEITDDKGDGFSVDPGKLTMPRARVSSPEACFFRDPLEGTVVDPATATVTSHEERTRAWVDLSTDMSKCKLSERLHKEPTSPSVQCENCGSMMLLQPRISPGTDDFTNKFDQRYAFSDRKGNVADAHCLSSTDASPDGEVRLRPTKESYSSSLSWTRRSHIRTEQHPIAMKSNEQEPEPRSSCGDSEISLVTNSSVDPEKINSARRSTSCDYGASSNAAPFLRRNSLQEKLELNQPPASRPNNSTPSRILLQNQAQVTEPMDLRIKDNLEGRSTSTVWLEALRSSPQWPNPTPKTSTHAGANDDSDDESDNDSDICSTVTSSEHETSRAVSLTGSLATPVLCKVKFPPPKLATWEISEKLLKSSSLLKSKQERQESHESPRSSFNMVEYQESTTLPSPQYDSEGADPATVVPAGGPSETTKPKSGVLSKVAQWESQAGVGSSGKSLPIYLTRRRGIIISTGKPVSR
ncbi:hypothetical protein M758_5G182200 [Ceratodon purpureus]|nr:hypothetical protein M758_5G182200 [Ceratodon purpureus]